MTTSEPANHRASAPNRRGNAAALLRVFLQHGLLLLVSAVFVTPIIWMVGESLRPGDAEAAALEHQAFWPEQPRWENYPEALSGMPFWRYLLNTLLLCVGSVAGTLVSCTLVAYAFARLDWPGRDWVFAVVIATMLLPWQATMIPRFLLIRELGLYNTLGALVLPTFCGDAFYIFLLRQFFRSIPQTLVDAARIDGCGDWGVLCRVVLPLSRPALVTVGVLQTVAVWNDYGGPLLYLSDPAKLPLAYGLERFVSSHSSETHLLMAAAVVFTLPVVLVFFTAQRVFVRGASTTGLKE